VHPEEARPRATKAKEHGPFQDPCSPADTRSISNGYGDYSSPSSIPRRAERPLNIEGTPIGGAFFTGFFAAETALEAAGAAFLAGFLAAFLAGFLEDFLAERFFALFFAVLPAAFLVVLVFFAVDFFAADFFALFLAAI
jgi:hypothetical protein